MEDPKLLGVNLMEEAELSSTGAVSDCYCHTRGQRERQ
jgi:hypothetical protein